MVVVSSETAAGTCFCSRIVAIGLRLGVHLILEVEIAGTIGGGTAVHGKNSSPYLVSLQE